MTGASGEAARALPLCSGEVAIAGVPPASEPPEEPPSPDSPEAALAAEPPDVPAESATFPLRSATLVLS